MRIQSVELLNGTRLPLGRVSIIFGGNDVGKTTLLREMYRFAVTGDHERARWIKSIQLDSDDPATDASTLLSSLDLISPTPTERSYRSRSARDGGYGLPAGAPNFNEDQKKILEGIVAGTADNARERLLGAWFYRAAFVAYLSCDNRLAVPHQTQIIAANEAASDPLNVLYRESVIYEKVADRIRERFGLELVLLDHLFTQLRVGLSTTAAPPELLAESNRQRRYELIEEWRTKNVTPLSEAGHGVRAITHLLLSMFDPTNQVLLVDEPELHLYPAEKRALGRSLVELATEQKRQVVAVTHDASFLQGVLDASGDVDLVRVHKTSSGTRATRHFPVSSLTDLTASYRQREYLNALFYQHVVIVEGPSDRLLYQEIADHERIGVGVEVGYAAGNGKGGTTAIAALCDKVGVPFVAIYDFDVLLPSDFQVLKSILEIRSSSIDTAALLATILEAIQSLGGGSPAEKKLKKAGVETEGLPQAIKVRLLEWLDRLASDGVFVVPRGELEQWFPSIDEKARFAETAVARIRAEQQKGSAVSTFLRGAYDRLIAAEETKFEGMPAYRDQATTAVSA